MTTPTECRVFANECFRQAEQANTDALRRAFLNTARAWTLTAMQMEGVLIPDDTMEHHAPCVKVQPPVERQPD